MANGDDTSDVAEDMPNLQGNPMSNLAQWNSQLSGFLGGLASQNSAYMPEQRQQFANLSTQLTQDAANRTMHKDSPLHRIGNALSIAGAGIAGIAPGSSGVSFNNMSNVIRTARDRSASEDRRIANELKMAQQASQMGADPKMISQILRGYQIGGSQALGSVNAANRQAQIDYSNRNAQARIQNTGIANQIKRDALTGLSQYRDAQTQLGNRRQDDISQYHNVLANHYNRMDALNERLRPYEAQLKERGLDQNQWTTYQKLVQADKIARMRAGMDYMKLQSTLAARSSETIRDKNGIHYKLQTSDEAGKPTGQQFEITLPDLEGITSQMSQPTDFKNMSDDELADDSALGGMQQQQPIQQPMPQRNMMPLQSQQQAQPMGMAPQQPQPGAAMAAQRPPVLTGALRPQVPPGTVAPGQQPLGSPAPPREQSGTVPTPGVLASPPKASAPATKIISAQSKYDKLIKGGMKDTQAWDLIVQEFGPPMTWNKK